MACKDIVWKVGPFIDGELQASERDEVEAHLGGCEDCCEMAVKFRQLDELAGQQEVPSVSGQEWTRLWEGVLASQDAKSEEKIVPLSEAHPSLRGQSWSPSKRWLLAAAAAAAVFALGVFVGSSLLDGPGQDDRSVIANDENGQEKAIQHASGYEPEISGETIIYDEDF
jgi:anti-sigma factor RsiW